MGRCSRIGSKGSSEKYSDRSPDYSWLPEAGCFKPYAKESGEALEAFIKGRAEAKDVSALTLLFKEAVSAFFPDPMPAGSDDLMVRELLVKVANIILLRLKDAKVTEQEAEEIGVALRRLWFIVSAYRERKKESTLAQWLDRLSGAAKESGIQV